MKIYILWNGKEDRPIIHRYGFGDVSAFMAIENAQADLADYSKDNPTYTKEIDLTIREFILS